MEIRSSAPLSSAAAPRTFDRIVAVAHKIANQLSSLFQRTGSSQTAQLRLPPGAPPNAASTRQHGPQFGQNFAAKAAAVQTAQLSLPANAASARQHGPQFGQNFAANAAEGTTLNDYRVVGDKAKGVEPGFIAMKDWKPKDDASLFTHKPSNEKALQWISNTLEGPPGKERTLLENTIAKAIHSLEARDVTDAATSSLLKDFQKSSLGPADLCVFFLHCGDTDLQEKVKQLALADIVKMGGDADTAPLHRPLTLHVMDSGVRSKFTKQHYIKLDYYESDKTRSGSYTIPYAKAKAMGGIPVLGKLAHQQAKISTVKEINHGAVIETMSNDLMGLMGMSTQKLKIVSASYADGTPKLLLDGTHIDKFNDFDGEKNATKGHVYIKDGFLVRNTRNPTDPPDVFSGPPALHMDIKALGRQKVMMLLLADRDALGSKGGNKGYVGDQFFAIDPGHALEKSLLSKRGDVHSDLSFDAASVFKGRDYKNFTVFDQTPFAEKMEGVRHLTELKKSGEDTALFDTYAQKFGSEQGHDALNFSEDLLKTKEQYIGRRDDILNAFASRLAVDNYSFGEKIDADPAQKATSRDQTLNLLDGLEKLTSTTVATTNGKKGGIRLAIPQIQKPEHRKAWDVQQNDGRIEFTFQGKPADADKIMKTLESFNKQQPGQPPYTVERGPEGITLSVPSEHIATAQSALSYSNIMQYKHG